MSVGYPFTVEICVPGLPGTICELSCIAESEDNSSELASVSVISTTSEWENGRGYTHREFKRPISEFHWEWRNLDPILASMAPQIWAVARSERIAAELRSRWSRSSRTTKPRPTRLGIWEDA